MVRLCVILFGVPLGTGSLESGCKDWVHAEHAVRRARYLGGESLQ